jgi:hypothetical protein
MITDLKKAVERAESLSESEQKLIADFILDEVNWAETFKNSEDKISKLAEDAIQDYKSGKIKSLEF